VTVTPSDTDLAEYRQRIRAVLAPYPPAVVTQWEARQRLPETLLRELADVGVFAARWRHGANAGAGHLAVLVEETCQVSVALSIAVIGHSELFIGALSTLASTPGQRDLAAAAMAGEVTGCFAATEPAGGSDLTRMATVVTPDGDGWRLQGHKRYVSNAAQATHVLVLAATDGRAARDLTLVVAPRAADGVRLAGILPTVGSRACPPGELTFDAVLPADAVLGTPGMGLVYASQLLQYERLAICVQMVTLSRWALRFATAFARRRRHGEVRLIDRQVIRHRLAWAQARLWPLESRLRELLARTGAGELVTHGLTGLKMVAAAECERIVSDCMQVLGARGYETHYPLERIWRDVRLARVGGGSEEVMAELVGGRMDRPDAAADALVDEFIDA
jgi:alkylation response protein AidB-like acyl-CoA dehydrogenase